MSLTKRFIDENPDVFERENTVDDYDYDREQDVMDMLLIAEYNYEEFGKAQLAAQFDMFPLETAEVMSIGRARKIYEQSLSDLKVGFDGKIENVAVEKCINCFNKPSQKTGFDFSRC